MAGYMADLVMQLAFFQKIMLKFYVQLLNNTKIQFFLIAVVLLSIVL